MGKLKEYYHDEITEAQVYIPEPYLFKYYCHFKLNSQSYTIVGDDLARILHLAQEINPEIKDISSISIPYSTSVPEQWEFVTDTFNIPFQLFQPDIIRY
jgi:hypothetical protein